MTMPDRFSQDFDHERCATPGCANKPAVHVIGGKPYYSPLCEVCQSRVEAEEEARYQEQQARARNYVRWHDMGIPKRFFEENFNSFRLNSNNAAAYEACLRYADEFNEETSGGLLILGPCGAGKTHLAVAILKTVGYGYMTNEASLMDDVRFDYAREWDKVKGIQDRCMNEKFLILDDFASENRNDTMVTWLRDIMYKIANKRFEEQLPTIVTTNTTMGEFSQRLGPRTVSRLMDGSQVINLRDYDHRIGM